MTTKQTPTIEEIKQKVLPVLERYRARRAGLFGSVVRGEMRHRSDIDILVDFPEPIGLFEFAGLRLELEQLLERKVDLVQYQSIKPLIKDRILAEEVPVLSQPSGSGCRLASGGDHGRSREARARADSRSIPRYSLEEGRWNARYLEPRVFRRAP